MITLDFEVIYFSIFFLVSSILMYTFLDTTIKIIQGINPFFKRNLRLSRTISIISIIGFVKIISSYFTNFIKTDYDIEFDHNSIDLLVSFFLGKGIAISILLISIIYFSK